MRKYQKEKKNDLVNENLGNELEYEIMKQIEGEENGEVSKML